MATPYSEGEVYDVLGELYDNSVANQALTTDITRVEVMRVGATLDYLYNRIDDLMEEDAGIKYQSVLARHLQLQRELRGHIYKNKKLINELQQVIVQIRDKYETAGT